MKIKEKRLTSNIKNNVALSFKRVGYAVVALSFLSFSGCSSISGLSDASKKVGKGDFSHLDAIDPHLNLTRDDYLHMSATKSSKKEDPKLSIEKGAPPIPKIADILAAPRPPKIGESQIVSIAVTEDVPLKDVLIELSKLADIDIELDAGISGGINFVAKDKPFNEVVERISSMTGLRYSMKDGVLRFERDTSYIKNYTLEFLNMDRESNSSVNISTSVSSSGGSSSGKSSGGSSSSGGGSNGSSSTVTTKSTSDFWKSIESGIQQILSHSEAARVSENTLQSDVSSPVAKSAPAPSAVNVAGSGSSGGSAGSAGSAKYTINRQAGVLTIDATSKQHELIELFINELKREASSQVLIEAKIIEVDGSKDLKTVWG